jgi:hypothetical protein
MPDLCAPFDHHDPECEGCGVPCWLAPCWGCKVRLCHKCRLLGCLCEEGPSEQT